jgi:5-methylthioribose kinase
MLVSVINTTLDTCNYQNCSDACINYLFSVVNNCPVVFNNETYSQLWRTLIQLCYGGH